MSGNSLLALAYAASKPKLLSFSIKINTDCSCLSCGTIKKMFPEGHIEQACGTVEENRAYIRKDGKWANDEPETWKAFLRRIHRVIEYRKDAPPIEHGSGLEYVFPPTSEWVAEAEQAEQKEIW